MTNIKWEMTKPMVRVAKGTMIVFNNDGSFSSILYRSGIFKKYKIVDISMDKPTFDKVDRLIKNSNKNEWHYFRKQLNEIEELELEYVVHKYLLSLFKHFLTSK